MLNFILQLYERVAFSGRLDALEGRYEARLARLERMAHGQPATREAYVTFALPEFLEAAIEAAESETGLKIHEVHPLALSREAGTNLANGILEGEMEIRP